MDTTTMKARCATRFRDPDNLVVTAVEWLAYLNDAYMDIVGSSPFWPFLETRSESTVTVLAGTRSIALPTNVTRVLAVRNNTDDLKLEPIDGRVEHLRWDPTQTETGTPSLYRVLGSVIEVYPIPTSDTVLALEYPVTPALLVADGDVPAFPAQYHLALIEGALYRAYVDDGAPEQAAIHQGQFDATLGRMMGDLLGANQQERSPGIVDDWWWS